ncbi:DUF2975 domain-containing protein [Parasalinivibrio latis]|uniref:DUF2975 domain-containing protein n=1 Tax=Parasalinivibrio latis TaxID=2952610 RepID=UPI0030E07630
MTRQLSLAVNWGCLAALISIPLLLLYGLFDISAFRMLILEAMPFPVQWQTVESWQLYLIWTMVSLYLCVGLAGLYYLRKAFVNFSRGELFNLTNSTAIRRFAVLLLIQAACKPIIYLITSVLITFNHPAGQKTVSISFGSHEIVMIGMGFVLWVISELLVEGVKLRTENDLYV